MHVNIQKNHRTILFIDARDPSGEFEERANRLIASLNGQNIKVDVHAVTNGGASVSVYPVSQIGDIVNHELAGDGFDIKALRQLARDYGYDQALFSVQP